MTDPWTTPTLLPVRPRTGGGPDGAPAVECDGDRHPLRRHPRRRPAVVRRPTAARCWPCSARTAPARPAPSKPSRATGPSRRARSGCSASTPVATTPPWCPAIGVMLQKGGVYPMLGPAQVLRPLRRLLRRPRGPRRPARPGRPGQPPGARPWRRLSGGEQQRLSPGARPGRPARGALPRRAHRRCRPRGPDRGPRPHRRPARQGTVRPAHHPRAGRGRAGGRPGGHRRPGTATGRGDSGRTGLGDRRRLGPVLHRPGHRHRRHWPPPSARRAPSTRSVPAPTACACRRGPRPRPWWRRWPHGWPGASLSLGDLRTGQSLEEAYLSITGARAQLDRAGDRTSGASERAADGATPAAGRR